MLGAQCDSPATLDGPANLPGVGPPTAGGSRRKSIHQSQEVPCTGWAAWLVPPMWPGYEFESPYGGFVIP